MFLEIMLKKVEFFNISGFTGLLDAFMELVKKKNPNLTTFAYLMQIKCFPYVK